MFGIFLLLTRDNYLHLLLDGREIIVPTQARELGPRPLHKAEIGRGGELQ